eukprot:TRINITY_DN1946_c0_g1_i1.p1 TRINITY_DN1946_c0_g1~~TRINITY_DN1946_c0_g1_i1.p1  ORF type:complete len:271 (-),score=79.54 TRINITY_DN1946_c0_g1_i1:36-848(-)
MTDQLDYALDLMRRLPPSQVENNLAGLIDLCPDLIEDLLASVDQPLKIAHDTTEKKDYLLCDYNRDGDSYRSPWSNTYDPQPDYECHYPSNEVRELEIAANSAFNTYRELYYEGGVSSAYLWDGEYGFAGCVLIKKTQDHTRAGQPMKGTWDSIHVFESEDDGNSAKYILTTTVMLTIETETEATGSVSLAGNLTRQDETTKVVDAANPHIANIGSMIEATENRLRNTINTIYFGRTKDVINNLREKMGAAMKAQKELQKEIGTALNSRN